ncbi:MAG: hypothetical protein Q8O34_01515 [Rhodocyclaceae bacterium]|nr:hypothetical protein [Rhodocyclaceae bacterium]
MHIDTAKMARQLSSTNRTAMERGGRERRQQVADITAASRQPDQARLAMEEALDGLFRIYQKTNQVVIGIKEIAAGDGRVSLRV